MALDVFMNCGTRQTAEETLRFELELAPPTDGSTNEWSYVRLVDDTLKKDQRQQKELDPFDDDSEAKVAAIARRFEEKYCPRAKKRKLHESDLIDRGKGYDKSDSFVDDSEAYEDFVPAHVDTQFGGFYINTGDLEFKPAADVDSDDLEFAFKKKKLPKLKKQPSHTTPQAILASQKLKKAKQHVASHKAPKSLQRTLFPATTPSSVAPVGTNPLVKQASRAKPVSAAGTTKKPKKVVTKPDGASALAVIKSLPDTVTSLSGVPESSAPSVSIGIGGISVPLFELSKLLNGTNVTTTAATSASGHGAVPPEETSNSVQTSPDLTSVPEVVKPPPVLPDNLPPLIVAKIHQLEEAIARDQGADGKVSNKARAGYDEQLVSIELACKAVTIKTRTAVLEYLAYKLGVSRGTLVKRIKQMLRKKEDDALTEPLRKLKEAVDASMPEQLVHYEEEVKARAESTSSQSDKMEIDEESRMDDVFEDSQLPSISQQETTGKGKRPPRKKYKWSDETRKLLCDVVRVKVGSEENINRIGRGNGEEIVTKFLEERVKPLWPKGWMQRSVLYKVSDSVHKHFTSPEKQPRRATVKREKDNPPAAKKEEVTKPVTHPSLAMLTLVPTTSAILNPLNIKSGPITVPKLAHTAIATRTIQSAPSSKSTLVTGSGTKVTPRTSTGGNAARFSVLSLSGEKIAGGGPAGSLHTITSASAMQAAGQLKQSILKGKVTGATPAGSGNRVSEMMLVQQRNPEAKPTTTASMFMTQDTISAMLIPSLLQAQIPSLQASSSAATTSTSSQSQIQAALCKIAQTNRLSQAAQSKPTTTEGNLGSLPVSKSASGTNSAAAIKTVPLEKVSTPSPPPSIVKAPTGRRSPALKTQSSLRLAPSTQQVATTQVHAPTLHYPPMKLTAAPQGPHRTPSPLPMVNKPPPSQVTGQSVIMAARPSGFVSAVTSSGPSLSLLASTSSDSSQSEQVESPMEQILKEHSYDSHQPTTATAVPVLQRRASPVVHTASHQALVMLAPSSNTTAPTSSVNTNTTSQGKEFSQPLVLLAQSSNTTAPTSCVDTSNTNTASQGKEFSQPLVLLAQSSNTSSASTSNTNTASQDMKLSQTLLMLAQSSNATAHTSSASTSTTVTVGHGGSYPIASSSAGSQQSGPYLNTNPAAKLKMPAPP